MFSMTSIMDPVFAPLLRLPPVAAIAIISLIISVLISIVYKFFTDQKKMHALKDELKDMQKEFKKHKDNPSKLKSLNSRMMQVNMDYMSHSFKAMMITLIPVIIMFSWLNAHLAYMPIEPDQAFTTTMVFKGNNINGMAAIDVPEGVEILGDKEVEVNDGKAHWVLKGKTGEYRLEYTYDNQVFERDVLISPELEYAPVRQPINKDSVKEIRIDNQPSKPLQIGSIKLSVIWTYVLFSLVFSMVTRKAFGLA